MTAFTVTDHATIRMAQRGMSLRDAELAVLIGTEVDDGYLVLAKNCKKLESELKALLDRVRRLQGKRLVTANGRILTAYYASKRRARRLRRDAQENDLEEWSLDRR
jgi:hypothetical protein